MSVSSGPTLVSPAPAGPAGRAPASGHVPPRRHPSVSAHTAHTSHTAHTTKRRTSSHAHTTASTTHAGSSRRPSEGEGGRRALVAGLTMHAMDGKPKRKGSAEVRPLPKSTKSDTHLPRLSRQGSNTSQTSNSSQNRQKPQRAKPSRKKSGESVELDAEGRETQTVDSDEEGWESGEDVTGKSRASAKSTEDPMSLAMWRTQSETGPTIKRQRSIPQGSALVTSPEAEEDNPMQSIGSVLTPGTTKTTGFAGAVQNPDPGAQTPAHALNDPTHVMPAHQVRHQASVRSLHAMQNEAESPGGSKTHHRTASNRSDQSTPSPVVRTESNRSDKARNSAGSAAKLPDTELAKLQQSMPDQTSSPSFPFPRLRSVSPETQYPTPPRSPEDNRTAPAPPSPGTKSATSGGQPRHTSERLPPSKLKHRYSNSSLRSIQSLRAPPHPLNATGDYRSVSGASITNGSPSKDRRASGMHHPPAAPPVVYREVVAGQGFAIPEDTATSPSSYKAPTSATTASTSRGGRPPRTGSFSSVQSLKGALTGGSSSRTDINTSSVASTPSTQAPTPTRAARRRTALEAASAASKLQSTNDPALYHSSLGYPSTEAETAHLISRFLPPKKLNRPKWEISSSGPREDQYVGLANGDYREAHESLIHTMRTLGVSNSGGRRSMSRSTSYNLLGMTTAAGPVGGMPQPENTESVGVVKSRNGPMVVSRGGWGGRTPFELSVERCLAQRPPQTLPGL